MTSMSFFIEIEHLGLDHDVDLAHALGGADAVDLVDKPLQFPIFVRARARPNGTADVRRCFHG